MQCIASYKEFRAFDRLTDGSNGSVFVLKVHSNLPAIKRVSIQFLNGFLGEFRATHLNKSKTSGLAIFTTGWNCYRDHLAKLSKEIF